MVSDLLGIPGCRIIEALIRGEDSPEILSWDVRQRLRKKEKLVKESLKGYLAEFHRSMLAVYNTHYQFLTQQVADFEQRLATRMALYRKQEQLLVTIPGVK